MRIPYIAAEVSIRWRDSRVFWVLVREICSCCHSLILLKLSVMSELRRIRQLRFIYSTHRRRVSFKTIAFKEYLVLMKFWVMSVRDWLWIGKWIMKSWALSVIRMMLLLLIHHFWLRYSASCLFILWLGFVQLRWRIIKRALEHAVYYFLSILLILPSVLLYINFWSERRSWIPSLHWASLHLSWRRRSIDLWLFIQILIEDFSSSSNFLVLIYSSLNHWLHMLEILWEELFCSYTLVWVGLMPSSIHLVSLLFSYCWVSLVQML